jgi:hypothetical protein
MAELFANNAATTLSAAITTAVATTLTVTSATAFPSTGNFRVRVDSEIMLVTGVSGTTFTITRGAESTTAATHLNGATVTHVLTAGGLAAGFVPVTVYQTLVGPRAGNTPQAATSTTLPYLFSGDGVTLAGSSASSRAIFDLDPAYYAISGLTAYLRVVMRVSTNATAPAKNYTLGLYPATSAGATAATEPTATAGTVVTGSTVTITTPAASSTTSAVGTDFACPAAGAYAMGVIISSTGNTAAADVVALLQLHWA